VLMLMLMLVLLCWELRQIWGADAQARSAPATPVLQCTCRRAIIMVVFGYACLLRAVLLGGVLYSSSESNSSY